MYEKSVDKGENDDKELSSLSKTDSDPIQVLAQKNRQNIESHARINEIEQRNG